jgi:hypothetical protein
MLILFRLLECTSTVLTLALFGAVWGGQAFFVAVCAKLGCVFVMLQTLEPARKIIQSDDGRPPTFSNRFDSSRFDKKLLCSLDTYYHFIERFAHHHHHEKKFLHTDSRQLTRRTALSLQSNEQLELEQVDKTHYIYLFSSVLFSPALLFVYPWPLARKRWQWPVRNRTWHSESRCDGWLPYYVFHFFGCFVLLNSSVGRIQHVRAENMASASTSDAQQEEFSGHRVHFKDDGGSMGSGQITLRMAVFYAALTCTVLMLPLVLVVRSLAAGVAKNERRELERRFRRGSTGGSITSTTPQLQAAASVEDRIEMMGVSELAREFVAGQEDAVHEVEHLVGQAATAATAAATQVTQAAGTAATSAATQVTHAATSTAKRVTHAASAAATQVGHLGHRSGADGGGHANEQRANVIAGLERSRVVV